MNRLPSPETLDALAARLLKRSYEEAATGDALNKIRFGNGRERLAQARDLRQASEALAYVAARPHCWDALAERPGPLFRAKTTGVRP